MIINFEELSEKHLDEIAKWRMLPHVTNFMYTDPKITKKSQKEWYNSFKNDKNNRNWVIVVEGINIGFVNLKINWVNRSGFWAYYIGEPEYIGKGIGKQIELNILRYVFEILDLNKLICEVFEFNDKVIKIHEKYGSKIEGLLKEHICKNGVFYNVVVMGILKNEWKNIKDKFDITFIDIKYNVR